MTDKPPLDPARVKALTGKYILIGIDKKDSDQKLLERQEVHGVIDRITAQEGLVIKQSGDKGEYRLPPDLRGIKEAPKGDYRLKTTGEVVKDPDVIAVWTITTPAPFKKRKKKTDS